jgi:hypothetical protein
MKSHGKGTLYKMKAELPEKGEVQYSLPLGDITIPLNEHLEKKVKLSWSEKIYDVYDGKEIKKSFAQGYSYKNFISLAQCDTCIVKPELCHYHKGTCREPEWGEKHCFIPHYVYLSITSGVKIGITRETQVPTRWIDQGAVFALPILKVPDRKTSGIIEIEIAKEFADKTNWRKMLKGDYQEEDLELIRDNIYENYGDLLDDADAEDVEEDVLKIHYPIKEVPEKFSSFSFEKKKEVEGTLLGIKGQYLILDTGVINIRKHNGYEVEFFTEEL